jgi:hypothetical protein
VTYVARGFSFGKPDMNIIKPYELNKDIFFDKLLKDARNDIAQADGKPQLKKQRAQVTPLTPDGK